MGKKLGLFFHGEGLRFEYVWETRLDLGPSMESEEVLSERDIFSLNVLRAFEKIFCRKISYTFLWEVYILFLCHDTKSTSI